MADVEKNDTTHAPTYTEKLESTRSLSLHESVIDLATFHEKRAGRLIIDPE